MQLFSTYPKKKKIFGFFLFICTFFVQFFSHCTVFAQVSSPIDKDYLVESTKNKKTAVTVHAADNLYKKIDNKYRFIKINHSSALQFDIRPARAEKLPQKKLYGNYIKAGFGNFQSSYAEAFFDTRRSEKYSYGLHIKHKNARIGAIDEHNSADAQNQLLFNFQSSVKKAAINGSLGFQQEQWHFYGYQPNISTVEAKDIRQNFNIFSGQVNYTNKYKSVKYNYDVGLFYYYLMDYYTAKEQERGVSFANKIHFDLFNTLYFKAELSSSLRSDEAGSLRRDLLVGEMYHQMSNNKFFWQIGGRAAVHNDTLTAIQNVHFYPKLNFSFNFFKNKFDVYMQMEGDMQKRLLRNMLAENPYLASNIQLLHTNKVWETTIGLRSKLKGVFNWQASASYGMYQYLHFFMNSSSSPSKFVVQYETASVPITTLTNEIMLNLGKFKAKLRTEMQRYELQTIQKAWHRPLLKNTLSVSYNTNNLSLNLDFYHLAGIAVFDVITNQQKDLQAITDLNLKIDYQISSKWSLFIKATNLLAQQYQRYLYYDVRTAQLIGGVSLAF